MNNREDKEGKLVMDITQLIGLGETERRIYEKLSENGQVEGDLSAAYAHHELALNALIKYQKSLVPEQC